MKNISLVYWRFEYQKDWGEDKYLSDIDSKHENKRNKAHLLKLWLDARAWFSFVVI